MARTTRQLVLDDDSYVDLTLRLPASLYRAVHSYCIFREVQADQVPAVATAAIRTYFADNALFQAWLRKHPDLPVTLPASTRTRRRARRPTRAGGHEVGE